jgi:3-dehydrotetronate 4-kinase
MSLLLGCIADDFTGATDLANNLVRAGMRTVQTIGVPAPGVNIDAQAVVVALKSRTAPVAQAVAQSLAAARWLRAQGARQIYFKVCSTFDSTPQGNIGPVAQALADALGAGLVIVTPAFPENGRTVFKGHLFVGDLLLSDSPMRHHPLTPMTDANLVRVLQAQMPLAQVGLIDHRVLPGGVPAVHERMATLRRAGVRFAIADAVSDGDLRLLAQAAANEALVVAGSGLAIGIPALHGLVPNPQSTQLPAAAGHAAIVSGSCSAATQAQVQDFIAGGGAAWALDPLQMAAGHDVVATALAWALPRLGTQALLIYSTADAAAVNAVQAELGPAQAGARIEHALSTITTALVAAGVGRLLVAGGETAGACVQALGITQLRIGPQIDPGVPWCHADLSSGGLHLALKSGNFGAVDFFTRAFAVLP